MLVAFLLNVMAFPLGQVSAQEVLGLPVPGARVGLSPVFHPTTLTGVKVYAGDPFRFDFILDKGEGTGDDALRLIKYFLAALTVPEKDLWVNLSPYEKDRIVPEAFGQTEMGRDLLAQDYLLKQITASLMYPEDSLGKKFWDEIYKQAQAKFGTTDIPIDTFNKVWIVPAVAKVYEKPKPAGNHRPEEAVAYVVESRLKVMLESDYLAAKNNTASPTSPSPSWEGDGRGEDLAQALIRTIILPVLEKEVNEGQNFAQLRQVYNSLILAAWYKKKVMGAIHQSPLGFYVGQNKVAGVNIDDPKESAKIWSRYVASFKKGAYNLIREEYDPATEATIPRKYFAGGVNIYPGDMSMVNAFDAAGLPVRKQVLMSVRVNNIPKEKKPSSIKDNSSLEPRSKMPVKVLIFDLGDTLYHSSKVWGRKYRILLKLSKAAEYSAKEVKNAYFDENNNQSLSGVVRAFNLNSSAFNAKVDEIDVEGLLKPEQDMIALLKGLKQSYYLVLGSNASDAHVARVLKALGLEEIFDFIFTQENMGVGKPALDFYRKIQAKVPFPAEAFVSIGASQKDTVPAQKVGMQTVLVDGPEDLKNKVPGELDKINRKMADKSSNDSGGIDLNPVAQVMQVDASDAGTFFHFDPAMLEKYRGSAGVAPVIIDIQPMNDLPNFLGIAPVTARGG